MNQINPKKLLKSKWTAVKPINKEKHFLVTKVEFDEEGEVTLCILEAILSNRENEILWQDLKDVKQWLQGWK
ncbi:TIGR02450 family Trp-rich protein [Psychromonas algicola]|uniref:TIGR02450 family Trp-rich protein n=1 Tax=Psychromonas algicola TaxID=2555642 RepID=UPI0010689066|nr:TIGR02450 family Trp-rich protein [Psychromonas sp. RZ5]TEW51710.1 TIGR02450 family Trp-rich protein [Psychromonas sp. RZ5]